MVILEQASPYPLANDDHKPRKDYSLSLDNLSFLHIILTLIYAPVKPHCYDSIVGGSSRVHTQQFLLDFLSTNTHAKDGILKRVDLLLLPHGGTAN